jgi:hypothetical protein
VQPFAGLGGKGRELLEAYGGVDQVTQDQTGSFSFAVEKQGGCFVQECLRKRRITLYALNDSLLEISSQCHLFTPCVCCLSLRSSPSISGLDA